MGKRKKNKSVSQHVKRKKKQPKVAASGADEPVAKSKGQTSKEKVKADPEPHEPTPCRVEQKTRRAIVKDEHGKDVLGGAVIDVKTPQMKCTPPLPWVEGGVVVGKSKADAHDLLRHSSFRSCELCLAGKN